MKRKVALAAGIVAAAVAGLALGPAARAQEKVAPRKKVETRVIVRHPGGAYLGVGLDDLEGDARGAKIRSVESDSPAQKAGIKEGDVVLRFDGEPVRSAAQLARLVGETPSGRSVEVDVTRSGSTQKLTATLGENQRKMRIFEGEDFPGMRDFRFELPEPPEPPEPPEALEAPDAPDAPEAPRAPMLPHAFSFHPGGHDMMLRMLPGAAGPRRLGVEFMEIGDQLAAAYKLPGKGGVLVTSVDGDSPAAKGGLKAGDVVLKFDGKAIEHGAALGAAVRAAADGKPVTVTVQRDGHPLDLSVTLQKPQTRERRPRGVTL
jgi:S1-C subfamily serine protease